MRSEPVSGFTLLEIVVALAIAGLALGGLFAAGSGGVLSVETAGRVGEALQHAQSRLDAIGRQTDWTAGESEGDEAGGFHWRVRVEATASHAVGGRRDAAGLTLFDVGVAVSWQDHGRHRSVTLTTLRLGNVAGE